MKTPEERQNKIMDFVNRSLIDEDNPVAECHLGTATDKGFSELWDFKVTGLYEPISAISRITGQSVRFSSMRELAAWASHKDFNQLHQTFV